mgnify:CR=1 FL=1
MNIEDHFKYLVGAYYGVQTMDNYELKEYILKDIEDYIRSFIEECPIENTREKADNYESELALKTKLQDALLVLNQIDAPMEIILLIKQKIKNLK